MKHNVFTRTHWKKTYILSQCTLIHVICYLYLTCHSPKMCCYFWTGHFQPPDSTTVVTPVWLLYYIYSYVHYFPYFLCFNVRPLITLLFDTCLLPVVETNCKRLHTYYLVLYTYAQKKHVFDTPFVFLTCAHWRAPYRLHLLYIFTVSVYLYVKTPQRNATLMVERPPCVFWTYVYQIYCSTYSPCSLR